MNIPNVMSLQTWAVKALIALAATIIYGGGCFYWGYHTVKVKWDQANIVAKAEEDAKKGQGTNNTKEIEIRYVDRVKIIEKQGQTIVNNVNHYITSDDNTKCQLPVGFVRMLDDALTVGKAKNE